MSKPLNPRIERGLHLAIDFGERIFIALLFANLAARLLHTIEARPYNLLILLSEGLIVLFVLVRRPAKLMTLRPLDWAIGLAGTALAMFVYPGGQPLLPETIGTIVMFAGFFFAMWAKLSLRRSFGIVAANRGAVIAGPYRFVRHPMYSGYLVIYVGFLLNNPLPWNFAVYGITALLLVIRLRAEEKVLQNDPVYAGYSSQVSSRLIPILY